MPTLPGRPRGAAAGAHRLRRRAPLQGRDRAAARRARAARTLGRRYAPRRRPTFAARRSASTGRSRDGLAGRRRCYERVGASSSASRSRTSASTSRTATATAPTPRRTPRAMRRGARGRARACGEGTLPPFIGIRIKSFSEELDGAQRAHARPVPRHAARARPAARCPTTSWSRCRRSRSPSRSRTLVRAARAARAAARPRRRAR